MFQCGKFKELASSLFFPSVLISKVVVCQLEMAIRNDINENHPNARTFFLEATHVNLLNLLVEFASFKGLQPLSSLEHHKDDGVKGLALWEDYELWGFLPLLPIQSALEFSNCHLYVGIGDKKGVKICLQIFFNVGKIVVKALQNNGNDIIYN